MTERDAQHGADRAPGSDYRAGFIAFVGRPNVGKSTLMNALVGTKVAITSAKPQTTRRAIRGLVHRPDGQIVIVDTPGLHRPRTLLGERLNALVDVTLGDVDVIACCFPADQPVGPGDRFLAASLDRYHATRIAVVTKTDAVARGRLPEQLVAVDVLRDDWATVIPVSAHDGSQLDTLNDAIVTHLPPSAGPLYPADMLTEEAGDDQIADRIREAFLAELHDELPHSLAVVVSEVVEEPDDRMTVYATVLVERDSQKGIVIGRGGERLSRVRAAARRELTALLHQRVTLSLRVSVAKEWQRDPKQLGRLGL